MLRAWNHFLTLDEAKLARHIFFTWDLNQERDRFVDLCSLFSLLASVDIFKRRVLYNLDSMQEKLRSIKLQE